MNWLRAPRRHRTIQLQRHALKIREPRRRSSRRAPFNAAGGCHSSDTARAVGHHRSRRPHTSRRPARHGHARPSAPRRRPLAKAGRTTLCVISVPNTTNQSGRVSVPPRRPSASAGAVRTSPLVRHISTTQHRLGTRFSASPSDAQRAARHTPPRTPARPAPAEPCRQPHRITAPHHRIRRTSPSSVLSNCSLRWPAQRPRRRYTHNHGGCSHADLAKRSTGEPPGRCVLAHAFSRDRQDTRPEA